MQKSGSFQRSLSTLVRLLIFYSCLGILEFGCTTTHGKQVYVEGVGNITIGFEGNRHNGYFALVEEKSGTWIIKELQYNPIKGRKNISQEVLRIDLERNFVEPYFEAYPRFSKPKGNSKPWFECNFFLYKSDGKYTPCNSKLTTPNLAATAGKNILATGLTFGLASGTNRGIDIDQIANILQQTRLIEKVNEMAKACEVTEEVKARLKEFARNIRLEPKIIDQSGLLSPGDDILTLKYKIKSKHKCVSQDVSLEIILTARANFKATIEPNIFTFDVKSLEKKSSTLRPAVIVHEKRLNMFSMELSHADEYLAISLKMIQAGKGKICIQEKLEEICNLGVKGVLVHGFIENKSNKYITLASASLYIGSQILTRKFDWLIPPHGTKAFEEVFPTMGNTLDSIPPGFYSKSTLSNTTISLGVAAQYRVDGMEKTLPVHRWETPLLEFVPQVKSIRDQALLLEPIPKLFTP